MDTHVQFSLKLLRQSMEDMERRILHQVNSRLEELEQRITNLEMQEQEDYQVLDAIQHVVQVHKAEHDRITLEMAQLSGEICELRRELFALADSSTDSTRYIRQKKKVQ